MNVQPWTLHSHPQFAEKYALPQVPSDGQLILKPPPQKKKTITGPFNFHQLSAEGSPGCPGPSGQRSVHPDARSCPILPFSLK